MLKRALNNNKFVELRSKFSNFIYDSFNVIDTAEFIEFSYNFEIEGLSKFNPKWKIYKVNDFTYDKNILYNLIFNLGIVEAVSYWKLTCSKNIIINNEIVDNLNFQNKKNIDIDFYKKLFINGLGEFFYINSIDIPIDLLNFKFDYYKNIDKKSISDNTNRKNVYNTKNSKCIKNEVLDNNKILIPIGGGKDSCVTIELLKNNYDCYGYIINERVATKNCFISSNIDLSKKILSERILDKNMLSLNEKGFLNGHTPFSAICAFSSVIAAYINGIKYVALSNESSANETTVINTNINHQYSKSVEFENDFINYEKEYINSNVQYFSLLRPFTELAIAKMFSKMTNYHKIFRSCNVGSKKDIWCGKCAKCLFVFIILSVFLSVDELTKIIGNNMLNESSNIEIFDELVGMTPEKPFECVGSREEVIVCILYLLKKYDDKKFVLLEHFKNNDINECIKNVNLINYNLSIDDIMKYDIDEKLRELYTKFDTHNFIPKNILDKIKNYVDKLIVE